jgi:hypothetical protein
MELNNTDWKVDIVNENPTFPFLVIDNWYNPIEEKSIWKELDFYSSFSKENLERSEDTVVAKNEDGTSKGYSYRWYLDNLYTSDGMKKSNILNTMYKVRSKEFHNIINKITPYGRSFLTTNMDSTIVSYYEENDHYDSHHDTSLWTQLIWFVKEPRIFTGGDFIFPESNYEIKLKHNRAIFFPCCYLHKVTPVKFNSKPEEMGYGRYTITHFYSYAPGK